MTRITEKTQQKPYDGHPSISFSAPKEHRKRKLHMNSRAVTKKAQLTWLPNLTTYGSLLLKSRITNLFPCTTVTLSWPKRSPISSWRNKKATQHTEPSTQARRIQTRTTKRKDHKMFLNELQLIQKIKKGREYLTPRFLFGPCHRKPSCWMKLTK